MDAAENLYNALVEDFGMEGATGSVRFKKPFRVIESGFDARLESHL